MASQVKPMMLAEATTSATKKRIKTLGLIYRFVDLIHHTSKCQKAEQKHENRELKTKILICQIAKPAKNRYNQQYLNGKTAVFQ